MDPRFIDVKVNGNSMWPTLRDGDIVRFEIIDSKLIEPNQIVLFKHPFKKNFKLIKRISTIEDGEVFFECAPMFQSIVILQKKHII